MNPYMLIHLHYDLNEAHKLLVRLTELGVGDEDRFGIVNGMWNKTSDGFTWNELFTATKDFGLINSCGGLAIAKEKADRALKEGFNSINIPCEKGFAEVSTSTVVAALGRINDALKGKESVKLDAIQFIKNNGIEKARKELTKLLNPNVTHMTDDARMFIDENNPLLDRFHRSQIKDLICIDDLKRVVESSDLVEACGGLTEIKRHLRDGCYVGNEKVIVRKAIADYEAIYSIKLEVSFGVPLMPPENLAFLGVDLGD